MPYIKVKGIWSKQLPYISSTLYRMSLPKKFVKKQLLWL